MADDIQIGQQRQYKYTRPVFSADKQRQVLQVGEEQRIGEEEFGQLLGEDQESGVATHALQNIMYDNVFAERFGQDEAHLESSLAAQYHTAFNGHSSIYWKSKRAKEATRKIELQEALKVEANTFLRQRLYDREAARMGLSEDSQAVLEQRFGEDWEKYALREWLISKTGDADTPYEQWQEQLITGFASEDAEEYKTALKNVLLVCQNEDIDSLIAANDEEFMRNFADKYSMVCKIASGDAMLYKYEQAGGGEEGLDMDQIRSNIEFCKNLKVEYENRLNMISNPYYTIVQRSEIEDYLGADGERKLALASQKNLMQQGLIDYIYLVRRVERPMKVEARSISTVLYDFRKDQRGANGEISDREWNIQKAQLHFGITLENENDPRYDLFRKNTISKRYTAAIEAYMKENFIENSFMAEDKISGLADRLLANLDTLPDFAEIGGKEANNAMKQTYLLALKNYAYQSDRFSHSYVMHALRDDVGTQKGKISETKITINKTLDHFMFDIPKWRGSLRKFVNTNMSEEEKAQYNQFFNVFDQYSGTSIREGGIKTMDLKTHHATGGNYFYEKKENVLQFDITGTNIPYMSRGRDYEHEIRHKDPIDSPFFQEKFGHKVQGFESVWVKERELNGAKKTRYNFGGPTTFNGGEGKMQRVEERILNFGSEWLRPILEEMRENPEKQKDVHVILTGASRGAASTTAGIMRLSAWVHQNYPDLANFVKFETVLHDPTPGFTYRDGIYEEADIKKEKYYDANGRETTDDEKKVYRGAGNNISSTMFYTLKNGNFMRLLLDPMKVFGADRVIISPFFHTMSAVTIDPYREEDSTKLHRQAFIYPPTGEAYRGSGINDLPKGFYFADERNVLVRVESYEQFDMLMEDILKDEWRNVLRTNVVKDVAKQFFERK